MPLKLQAHVDSRIWSLQSTVSFFFSIVYMVQRSTICVLTCAAAGVFFSKCEKDALLPYY